MFDWSEIYFFKLPSIIKSVAIAKFTIAQKEGLGIFYGKIIKI